MAQMWITMGPQHPMTHGLWTLRVKVDGETVVDTEAELGYIHRGVEKIAEARDFTQVTPYCDRLHRPRVAPQIPLEPTWPPPAPIVRPTPDVTF